MKTDDKTDLQAILEHLSMFIDAVPAASDQNVNWEELTDLRRAATDSLQRLQDMAVPLGAPESGGDKCPGLMPKQ